MQEPLTNLINSLMPSLPASGGDKSSPLQGKEKGAFSDVLNMLSSSESGQETAAAKANGTFSDGIPSDLADLLQVLLISNMRDPSQSLQVAASADGTGIEKSSFSSAASFEVSGNSGSTGKTGLSVESLLSALAALFGGKGKGTDGTRGTFDDPASGAGCANQASDGTALTTTDALPSGGSATQGTAKGISSENSTDQPGSTQDTKDALQTLAMLVFNSLLAVYQKQPQETPANEGSAGPETDGLSPAAGQAGGTAGGSGQEMIYEALVGLERLGDSALSASQSTQDTKQGQQALDEANVDKAQADTASESAGVSMDLMRAVSQNMQAANRLKEALREENAGRSSNGTPEMTNAPPEASSDGNGSVSAQVTLAVNSPSADASDDRSALTVAIKTPSDSVAQTGVVLATNGAIGGDTVPGKESSSEKVDSTLTTIVKDLSPLLKRDEEGPSHNNGDEKERSSGQDSYLFAARVDAAGTGGTGQEETDKTSTQTMTTTSVERFEKIIDQFGSGNAQHDLTVKLDMGKEGSVILGLKDLGPSVTVEVKATDQGIVSLLQSQKDSIIKNLEGKDVHANIYIDPNASGTPDKRDRRETGRQRTFQPAPQADAGFGEFLDVFA